MQQRLFQILQRGELLLVNGFEAAGFGGEGVEFGNDARLIGQWRNGNRRPPKAATTNPASGRARAFLGNCAEVVCGLRIEIEECRKEQLRLEANNCTIDRGNHPLACVWENAASSDRVRQTRDEAIALEDFCAAQPLEGRLGDVSSFLGAVFEHALANVAGLNQANAFGRLVFAFDPIAIGEDLAQLGKPFLHPPLTPLAEDGLQVTFKQGASVLEVIFGIGFGGGDGGKGLVEDGDDPLLFGERGDGNLERLNERKFYTLDCRTRSLRHDYVCHCLEPPKQKSNRQRF